ncbi:MAG: hypothetical protein K6G22_09630 [Lachnospiraceae bacterium]|nr:hypothetical protein [Lachnospiraceae bacterium]
MIDAELNKYIDSGKIAAKELCDLVHKYAWDLDTSFEEVVNPDGSIDIKEHTWSMNSEHVHTLVTVDKNGKITDSGRIEEIDLLKQNNVKVIP